MGVSKETSKSSTAYLLNRYIWLAHIIESHDGITRQEINERWMNSSLNESHEPFPRKTFTAHKLAVERIFNFNIECSNNKYFIERNSMEKRDGVRRNLLDHIAYNNMINECHTLKSRILFEPVPGGQQFLGEIIHAMRENQCVSVQYQSYHSAKPHDMELHPYCVKLFRQRWYLLGYNAYYDKDHHPIRIYALDRMKSVKVLDKKNEMPKDFYGEVYLHNCFGIIRDEPAEKVLVKVYKKSKKHLYFQSLPLHHSQKIESETEDFMIFSYYIVLTYDFRQELLSHGAEIQILEPIWFRDQIKKELCTMLKQYE